MNKSSKIRPARLHRKTFEAYIKWVERTPFKPTKCKIKR